MVQYNILYGSNAMAYDNLYFARYLEKLLIRGTRRYVTLKGEQGKKIF